MKKEELDLYSDYLISSFSQTTATGLSRLLNGAVTHDRITAFLSENDFDSRDLWRCVKGYVREIESDEGVVIFDDSIAEKPYMDENEIVCRHWDHCGNQYVKGINLLNCLYFSKGVSIPAGFDIIRKTETYTDPKTKKEKRRSDVTENELMRERLKQIKKNRLKYRYVLTDTWFSSSENICFIKQKLKKDCIMGLKSNRLAAVSLKERNQGQWESVRSLQIPENQAVQVYLKGVDFPLLLVKHISVNSDASEHAVIPYAVISHSTAMKSEISVRKDGKSGVSSIHKIKCFSYFIPCTYRQNSVKSPLRFNILILQARKTPYTGIQQSFRTQKLSLYTRLKSCISKVTNNL